MALLKREEWQGFVRDVDWSYSYVDDEAVFPEWHSGTGKVPREAWQAWEESYKVSYPEYVATQSLVWNAFCVQSYCASWPTNS